MPAIATRAAFARDVVAARLRGRPMILSHLVTPRCNARCPTCLWRDEGPELDAETIAWLYGAARAAGLAQLVIWGGEPLLRTDLPRLLAAAKGSGLLTTLISNGWLLDDQWHELRGSVDVLILSVDDAGQAHDRLRGLPGLFSRLEQTVERLAGDPTKPLLLVNTVLSTLNRGALRRVAPVAKRWGAGLYFCPMETGEMRSGGFVPSLEGLALPPAELREAALLARELRGAGYPLLSTEAYLDLLARDPGLTGYTCRTPRAILTVRADGTIRDCLRRERPLTSVQELRRQGRGLESLFALPRYHQMLGEASTCTACNNPDVIETSWLWDLRPAMLRKAARLIAR